jgi:hypothetical protein
MTVKVNDQDIISACESSSSMSEACSKVGIHFNTFKRNAEKLGVYKTNQGSKGSSKPKTEGFGKIPLQDILDGKCPQYQTYKLKNRLFKVGLKTNVCECCGITEWMNTEIMCELDHIDGNSCNHVLNNLRILCPNCHSQTLTFRSKKRD